MDGEDLIDDALQILFAEEIVHDHAEIIGGIALLIFGVHELRGHLIVLDDIRSSVHQAHDADALIGRSLAHGLGTAGTAGGDRRADKDGVDDPLQDVVDREGVEPLDSELMHLVQQAAPLHGQKPAAVAVGGGRDPVLCLHVDLAVPVCRRRHLLLEEPDLGAVIAEVVHLFHEGDGLVVVLVAGHDKEGNVDAGSADDVHEVFDQALHDVDRVCQADVIHALGIV